MRVSAPQFLPLSIALEIFKQLSKVMVGNERFLGICVISSRSGSSWETSQSNAEL